MCDYNKVLLTGSGHGYPDLAAEQRVCPQGGVHDWSWLNPLSTVVDVPVAGFLQLRCTACGLEGACTE